MDDVKDEATAKSQQGKSTMTGGYGDRCPGVICVPPMARLDLHGVDFVHVHVLFVHVDDEWDQ